MPNKREIEVEAVVRKAKKFGPRGAHVVVPNRWVKKEVIVVQVRRPSKKRASVKKKRSF